MQSVHIRMNSSLSPPLKKILGPPMYHHYAFFLTAMGVRGGGRQSPGLKNFRASSVFRASASCSKILNDKTYFNTVKHFRANLFFRANTSCSKILNHRCSSRQIFWGAKDFCPNFSKLARKKLQGK